MNVDYSWKIGRGYTTPASVVGSILADIEQKEGGIKPESFVDRARPINSPTHDMFEWNDAKCGEQYRLSQARKIIGSITILRIENKEPTKVVRAFVSSPPTETEPRRYESIKIVMDDSFKRAALFEQAKREIFQWRERYKALSEFAQLFDQIDALMKEMASPKKRKYTKKAQPKRPRGSPPSHPSL